MNVLPPKIAALIAGLRRELEAMRRDELDDPVIEDAIEAATRLQLDHLDPAALDPTNVAWDIVHDRLLSRFLRCYNALINPRGTSVRRADQPDIRASAYTQVNAPPPSAAGGMATALCGNEARPRAKAIDPTPRNDPAQPELIHPTRIPNNSTTAHQVLPDQPRTSPATGSCVGLSNTRPLKPIRRSRRQAPRPHSLAQPARASPF